MVLETNHVLRKPVLGSSPSLGSAAGVGAARGCHPGMRAVEAGMHGGLLPAHALLPQLEFQPGARLRSRRSFDCSDGEVRPVGDPLLRCRSVPLFGSRRFCFGAGAVRSGRVARSFAGAVALLDGLGR